MLSGSLAILLVRDAAQTKDETLGAKDFLKVGLCVTPLTLLVAEPALWATFLVVRYYPPTPNNRGAVWRAGIKRQRAGTGTLTPAQPGF